MTEVAAATADTQVSGYQPILTGGTIVRQGREHPQALLCEVLGSPPRRARPTSGGVLFVGEEVELLWERGK